MEAARRQGEKEDSEAHEARVAEVRKEQRLALRHKLAESAKHAMAVYTQKQRHDAQDVKTLERTIEQRLEKEALAERGRREAEREAIDEKRHREEGHLEKVLTARDARQLEHEERSRADLEIWKARVALTPRPPPADDLNRKTLTHHPLRPAVKLQAAGPDFSKREQKLEMRRLVEEGADHQRAALLHTKAMEAALRNCQYSEENYKRVQQNAAKVEAYGSLILKERGHLLGHAASLREKQLQEQVLHSEADRQRRVHRFYARRKAIEEERELRTHEKRAQFLLAEAVAAKKHNSRVAESAFRVPSKKNDIATACVSVTTVPLPLLVVPAEATIEAKHDSARQRRNQAPLRHCIVPGSPEANRIIMATRGVRGFGRRRAAGGASMGGGLNEISSGGGAVAEMVGGGLLPRLPQAQPHRTYGRRRFRQIEYMDPLPGESV